MRAAPAGPRTRRVGALGREAVAVARARGPVAESVRGRPRLRAHDVGPQRRELQPAVRAVRTVYGAGLAGGGPTGAPRRGWSARRGAPGRGAAVSHRDRVREEIPRHVVS